jgi:hypothetical protein
MKQSNASLLRLALTAGLAFDANSILAVEMDTSELELERTLIPEGEHQYRIGKPKINSGEKDGKPWAQLSLPLECVDSEVLSELGVEKISSRTQFFLDLDEDGRLAKGTNANINLAKAFQAAGLYGGEATIMQMEGKVVIGKTKQRTSDAGVAYNEVTSLAAVD